MATRSTPSIGELRAIARERGLKYYMHLSKSELFSLLQHQESGGSLNPVRDAKEDAVRLTEGAPATTMRSSEGLLGLEKTRKIRENDMAEVPRDQKKAKMIINTIDPIMLVELGPYTFEFTRANGSVVVYNVESLVQYILATGDFSEPETRLPFSDEDLRRLDIEASKAKLNVKSVVDAMKNKHEFEEEKVKRDGVMGLERCASEYVNKMLEIVESNDPEEGEMLLIMSVFPSFSNTFEQIRRNDLEYASHSMSHYIEYMKGPKNCPTVDRSGLLPIIFGFLEDVAKGKQGASAFGF